MARSVILWFTLAVFAVHLVLLQALGSLWQEPSRLKAMTTPFFTRELASSTPPKAPSSFEANQSVAKKARAQSAMNTVAKDTPTPSVPVEATATVGLGPETPDHAIDPSTTPSSTTTVAAGDDRSQTGLPMSAGLTGSSAKSADEAPTTVVGPSGAATPTGEPTSAPATPASSVVASAKPDSWPTDTRLSYAFTGNYRGPIGGKARVQWQRDGTRYQVRVELDLSGLNIFTMTSQGQVTLEGLQPGTYEETRLGAKGSQLAMEAQQIRLQDGKRVDRPPAAQDTASQFVELGHRFTTGRATLEVGKTVGLWLARPNAVAEWTYDIVAMDRLVSPRLGSIEAYHLKPRPLANPSGPTTAEMWIAPSLQYLPVRIKININADTWVDLMVEKIEQAEKRANLPEVSPAVP